MMNSGACAAKTLLMAEETRSDANAADGALVGASTQVLGDATVESLASPEAKMAPWWTTFKRALTGAVTGAMAAKMSGGGKDDADEAVKSNAPDVQGALNSEAPYQGHKRDKSKKKHSKQKSDGFRPPGWDKGKKTGWGDSDVPPGLSKNDDGAGKHSKD